MKKKIVDLIKKNYIVISYFFIAIIIELVGVFAINKSIVIDNPWMGLSLLGIFVSILLLIENQNGRFYLALILIVIQTMVNLLLIVLFEMTGTIFDFGMFNLRKDAMGILESIPINFTFVITGFSLILLFVLIAKRFTHRIKVDKSSNIVRYIKLILMVTFILVDVLLSVGLNTVTVKEDYTKKLERDNQEKYKELGITSCFANEIYKGLFFDKTVKKSVSEIQAFIGNGGYFDFTNDPLYGISKDKNVITILSESFEWFSFISDSIKYPYGIGYNEENMEFEEVGNEILEDMFPNLYRLYNSSAVMTNNYSREKTDISEMQSILGSYPSNVYLNYDYPTNDYPYSLVNLLKKEDEDIVARYFHNSFGSFYNREEIMSQLGFDPIHLELASEDIDDEELNIIDYPIVDSNVMYELGMTNAQKEGLGRNLDSEMMEYTKEIMFPVNERFYTYITTLTMHGMYAYRENLVPYYEKIDEYGILTGTTPQADHLRNYVACTMDFDKSLGIMLEYLEDNNLLDDTIIVVFGDHNTYYHGLSNYVKNIKSYEKEEETDNDFTLLFNVPLMIYDQNIGSRKIDKFTTTNDIVPTLMHLLGINYYRNLYFGNSVFTSTESILYSRAYNVFLDDDLYFFSINDIKFMNSNANKDYINDFRNRAYLHLQKLEYIDQITYYNLGKYIV